MDITVKATLTVDREWTSHMTPDEVSDYIRQRLSSAMGFRMGFRMQKIKLLRVTVNGKEPMDITVKATLAVDREWASHMTKQEVTDYIRARLASALGFRGKVRMLRIDTR